MNRLPAWAATVVFALAGCGGPSGVPVGGTVTLDGKPLSGAMVSFRPTGQKTEGLGGSGLTGADGKYVLREARGGKGIAAGDYAVAISRRLRPDGSAPPADVPPMDSDAREMLPAKYSGPQSTLRATVSKGEPVHDFPLVTKK